MACSKNEGNNSAEKALRINSESTLPSLKLIMFIIKETIVIERVLNNNLNKEIILITYMDIQMISVDEIYYQVPQMVTTR